MKIYLLGPINGCSDAEAKNWRLYLTSHLEPKGYTILDPMRRDYRGRELEAGIADEIVQGDLANCYECDLGIRFAPKPSEGAAQETLYLHRSLGKPVVAIVPHGVIRSPWLIRHTTVIVPTELEAVQFVITNYPPRLVQ